MAKHSKTQKQRSELSDRRMLAAAAELLIERGTAGTTLVSIGERSGYSRGLISNRYGSKANLFARLHDTVVSDWIARVQDAVGDADGLLRFAGWLMPYSN